MEVGQLNAALADLNQAVAKQSNHKHHCWALVRRAEAKQRMAYLNSAITDLDAAHKVLPLSESNQVIRQRCSEALKLANQ